MGFVKLNVNASFDLDLLTGTVLRDEQGDFIARGNWKIDWCANVRTTEALALRYGLTLAHWWGAIASLLILIIWRSLIP